MLDPSDLFDPDLVARVAGRFVPGPPSFFPQRGAHPSARRGMSLEFSEHTEYAPGDDLKDLDWKVVARTDRYYVKRHEDERAQRVVLVVDASRSMAYGGQGEGLRASKYHRVAQAAVAVGAALVAQGDAIGLVVAGGREGVPLPVRGGRAHVEAVMEVLAGVEPYGRADMDGAAMGVARSQTPPAAVFFFSDLLDPEVDGLGALGALAARGFRPRVLHLLHPDEIDLPYENTCRFLDLEGAAELVLDPAGVRRAYREEMEAFVRGTAAAAADLGIPYRFVGDDHLAGPLSRLVHLAEGPRWRS